MSYWCARPQQRLLPLELALTVEVILIEQVDSRRGRHVVAREAAKERAEGVHRPGKQSA